jgi:effector-binding domain-containing protein
VPKIEFRESKVLKLMNVLQRPVPMEELMNQGKYIAMVENWVRAKGYEAQGPLIVYSSGIKGMDGDTPIIDSYIMVQLKNNMVRLEIPYKFEKEIRVENCLMARFNDSPENMQYATQKLTLFAYENDLELTGETYMIFVHQAEDKVMADIFMPLKNKSEN